MLALLRLIFGFALFAVFAKALKVAGPDPQTEGPTDAGYVALAVAIGLLNAVAWAPLVGRLIADPLTGAFTSGHPGDAGNAVLQFAHKLALRGWRRLALLFAFLEGVRHPDLPGAFVLGLNHARTGSWLEKVFAREVWRFDNAENCLRAWRVLRRRGLVPGIHRQAEVNLLILSADREKRPEPAVLAAPAAPPPPPPVRNPRIRLFAGAPQGPAVGGQGVAVGGDDAGAPGMGGEGSGTEAVDAAAVAATPVPVAPAPLAAGSGRGMSCPTPGPVPVPVKLTFRERLRVLVTGRLEG